MNTRRTRVTPGVTEVVQEPTPKAPQLVLSPTSKKILEINKKSQKIINRSIQEAAFKELLKVRGANGGNKVHGDIATIVKKYQNRGCLCVTRHDFDYRLKLMKEGKLVLGSTTNNVPPVQNVTVVDGGIQSQTSTLTPPPVDPPVPTDTAASYEAEEAEEQVTTMIDDDDVDEEVETIRTKKVVRYTKVEKNKEH